MPIDRPTIAFLTDFYLGDYQTTLHNAIESAAKQHDANLLCIIGRGISTPVAEDRVHNAVYESISANAISGIICLGTALSHYCGAERILSFCRGFAPLPVCNIGLALPGIPSIMVNNRRFGEIPRHLAEVHQCRRFAYIGGPPANEEAKIRRAAFLAALEARGIPFDPALEAAGLFDVQSGYDETVSLLDKEQPFDALVTANDEMAVGALAALKQRGIRVGEAVRLMGFDDIPTARFTEPKLSTMRTPVVEMGRRAVSLIIRQMQGESVPLLSELDPVPVGRETCGCHTLGEAARALGAGVVRQEGALGSGKEVKTILEVLLATHIHIPETIYPDWPYLLVEALFSELDGRDGAVLSLLTQILEAADHQLWVADELQNAVTLLRQRLKQTQYADSEGLADIWDAARSQIFDEALHKQMARLVAANTTSRMLAHRTRGALPATLSREALVEAVAVELRTIGVQNGLVSIYTSAAADTLECVAAVANGQPLAEAERVTYPGATLVPEFMCGPSRTSYVVLVLSSRTDRLGLLVLELGGSELYYEMCREHMSAYLKNMAFHQAQVLQLRAENDQTRRELELQHRQKLESLGVLAGGIAHDFNNMLSAILGNLDVAALDIEADTPNIDPILECKSVVKHAAGLCRQLLAYSGKGQFVVQRVDLNTTLRDLTSLLKLAVPKNVSLALALGDRLPHMEADLNQLNQVFVNLVINAAEAIGNEKGTVTVTTAAHQFEESELADVFADEPLVPGAYLIARIQDTGCGMTRATLDSIFDPFFTTKFTGRGLGLAAVLGIVRGHRGGIRVMSHPGRGTCFEVLFPSIQRTSIVPSTPLAAPPWKGRGTILVADDEPTVLRAAGRLLRRMGFSVIPVPDGQTAVDTFRDAPDAVDCVLLDISMPGLGGITAMREIREIRPDVPVLLTSGFSDAQAEDKAPAAPPAAFVRKPYDAEALGHALRQILR